MKWNWRTFIAGRVLRAAATVGGLTIVVKAIAMAKDIAIAGYFGPGEVVDAFSIAYLYPSFIVALLASSMNAALVPTFIQERESNGIVAAERLLCSALFSTQCLLLLLSFLLACTGPFILQVSASGFGSEKFALTLKLFWALIPTILLTGFSSNCAAVLNAEGQFALPALTPVVTPALTLLFLVGHGPTTTPWPLVFGAIAGAVVEAGVLYWALDLQGIRLRLRWLGMTPALRRVFSQYPPVIIAGMLSTGTTVVDQSMAAMLRPGSVAALLYAGKLVTVISGVTTFSFGAAVMPYYSELVARSDWGACRRTLTTYSRLLAGVMVPMSALFALFSHFIVRVIYERGAFTADDTALVSSAQSMYALHLSFSAVSILYVRMLTALNRNTLLAICSALCLGLDILFNLVLMKFFGVMGIALATTLFSFCGFVFARVMCMRALREVERSTPPSSGFQGTEPGVIRAITGL